ncbi:hypothetical protein FIBSPDRAFT_171440 [Athelia psychrophila]|uniref:CRIB domain-containing protein n=1 Tax=Athelia psychrophila TaxID=1759441 RepID=A0A166ATW5_9AGAM|nr:hypothetical protein FIBSPDRAFT_171440 [Fibularhizoctonia sp. CBS 109695]
MHLWLISPNFPPVSSSTRNRHGQRKFSRRIFKKAGEISQIGVTPSVHSYIAKQSREYWWWGDNYSRPNSKHDNFQHNRHIGKSNQCCRSYYSW